MLLARIEKDGVAQQVFINKNFSSFLKISKQLNENLDGEWCSLDGSKFLSPCCPSKIIGVGKNFPSSDIKEKPLYPELFFKPPSSLVAAYSKVEMPTLFRSMLVEGELAVVIGTRAKNILPEEVAFYILGLTIAVDFSGRDSILQEPLSSALKKGCDGMLPLGPVISLGPPKGTYEIRTFVNGEIQQLGNTADMFFSIEEVVSFASQHFTLEVGDVILMGTPEPKFKISRNAVVSVEIDRIGQLEFKVI
jgi:2-keto-4-pentenoate hydratase/2-oxohepta-3-ene-1,7-dioic acid hydratase in catechol pathway